MKRSGVYAGPGPVGDFVDRTAATLAYLRDRADKVAFVDLYQITLAKLGTYDIESGRLTTPVVLRWAAAEYDVPFEGVVYAGGGLARGPRIERDRVETAIGTEVTELEATIYLDGTDVLPPADADPDTPGLGLGEAFAGGVFDGARILLRRLILPAHPVYPLNVNSMAERNDGLPGDTYFGAVHVFLGRITGESELTRSRVKLRAKSYLEALEIQMPRNIYQPHCLWSLYDRGCGVLRSGSFAGAAFRHVSTVAAVAARDYFTLDDGPLTADGYMDGGTATFTSGVLCGYRLPIYRQTAGIIITRQRLPRFPNLGDGVVLQTACDKVGLVRDAATGDVTGGTCDTKFGNLPRFRGFPHTPPPETAY